MFLLAVVFPLSATGVVFTLADFLPADAEDSVSYYQGYRAEQTLSNNNFSTGVTNYNLNQSLTGWQARLSHNNTTAGVITTGFSFNNYSSNRFYLTNNPHSAVETDPYVLMINSRTSNSEDNFQTRQGYRSNNISLEANSYYLFQVSYKNDTNYNKSTKYNQVDTIKDGDDISLTAQEFSYLDGTAVGFDSHISFTKDRATYYLEKKLEDAGKKITADDNRTNVTVFYTDDDYVGFLLKDNAPVEDGQEAPVTPYYVSKDYLEERTVGSDTEYDIAIDAELFTCPFVYNSATKKYTVPVNTPYYLQETTYTSLNDHITGSIYLSGLKDEKDKPVECEYVSVSSKDWQTFYFFVATGDKTQSDVTLDLWLGSEDGSESSGVVFFDDCHMYRCSENNFWNTYGDYRQTKKYNQTSTTEDNQIIVTTQECTKLVDLRGNNNSLMDIYKNHNLDFEANLYNQDGSTTKEWTVDESRVNGEAQVFNVGAPERFKKDTGYNFVGSNFSCDVVLDENNQSVTIKENSQVLALWADNGNVKITSKDINVDANQVYKITAQYKIADGTTGNVYMLVSENSNVYDKLYTGLTKDDYTLAQETASSAVTSNPTEETSKFNNNYGTIEFYVKGGNLFNSSVNLSLALGNSTEKATGCVVFDDITIEKSTSEAFDSATNKVELGTETKTADNTVLNGHFDVYSSTGISHPLTAPNWTITKDAKDEFGLAYGGIVNTEKAQWDNYVAQYNKLKANGTSDEENPYYWASYAANPGNLGKGETTNNILMLVNANNTKQTVISDSFNLGPNSTFKLKFDYKTIGANFKLSLLGEDDFDLFRANEITSNGVWKQGNEGYEIYFKTLSEGTSNLHIQIELDGVGQVFFDNFVISEVEDNVYENAKNKVDMRNYYLDLPTNNIPNNLGDVNPSNTPAYSGTPASGNNSSTFKGGIVKAEAFANGHTLYSEKMTSDTDVFYIMVTNQGSYSLDSKYSFDLDSSYYYTLKFKLKTSFMYQNNNVSKDNDRTYEYGVTVGLTGYTYMTYLESADDYTEYTLHLKPTETGTAKLHIALVCDSYETSGEMAIYDLAVEKTDDSTEYDKAKNDTSSKTTFVAEKEGSEGENPDDGDDSTTDTDTATPDNGGFDWLLVPTLITALALVIAIVGGILRKVKIKKIEKKRNETYDRKESLNIDIVKANARKERDAELAEIKSTISKFEKELENIEKEHKQKVLDLREKDKGKVSKETDKEFKQFAQKRTVIAEKLESLNKKIEEVNSPEHLLSLERKHYAQEESKQKELRKASEKFNKEQEKKTVETKVADENKKQAHAKKTTKKK